MCKKAYLAGFILGGAAVMGTVYAAFVNRDKIKDFLYSDMFDD